MSVYCPACGLNFPGESSTALPMHVRPDSRIDRSGWAYCLNSVGARVPEESHA